MSHTEKVGWCPEPPVPAHNPVGHPGVEGRGTGSGWTPAPDSKTSPLASNSAVGQRKVGALTLQSSGVRGQEKVAVRAVNVGGRGWSGPLPVTAWLRPLGPCSEQMVGVDTRPDREAIETPRSPPPHTHTHTHTHTSPTLNYSLWSIKGHT